MENIKKAGNHFLNIFYNLVLAVIINGLFYLYISNAYSPEAILERTTKYIEQIPRMADAPSPSDNYQMIQAREEAEKQTQISQVGIDIAKERSISINTLMAVNFLIMLFVLYNLSKGANYLIEVDGKETIEEIKTE
jgi:hypothetical protein